MRWTILWSLVARAAVFAGVSPASGAPAPTLPRTEPPLVAWQAPPTYTPAAASGRAALFELGAGPVPFFPVTPCRQYDSRDFVPLPDATPRTVALSGAPCGIPAGTLAIAVNITVFDIVGNDSNGVFRVGTNPVSPTSWINYGPSETQRANAGVLPVVDGNLVVQVNQGAGSVDFIVDVFGYYPDTNSLKLPANDYFPIWGTRGGLGVIFGRNDEPSAPASHGVQGVSYSAGSASAGVEGEARAGSGSVFGVAGIVTSSAAHNAAGVYGRDASGFAGNGSVVAPASAGVRGESLLNIGVLGISNFAAVDGVLTNAFGTQLAAGLLGYAGYAVYGMGDTGATGTKSFVEPHPTDAGRVVKYVSLEGPEAGTYFRGAGRIEGGVAVVSVPDSFRWVTDEEGLTVHLTSVGGPAQLWVERYGLDRVVVRGNRDVDFHYVVHGVRRAYRDFAAVAGGREYMPRSAEDQLPAAFPEEIRRRLIANGTYNPDGSVNMETAARLGWTTVWAERAKPPAPSR